MRQRTALLLGLSLLVIPGCSSDDSSGTATTTPTTVTANTGATTSTIEVTTTTVDPALLPDPATMEKLVRDYCSSWPEIGEFLAEDVSLVDVSGMGWDAPGRPGTLCYVPNADEGIVRGKGAVENALKESGFSTIDCGGPAVIAGDLIALPVSAARQDRTGEEGISVFRIVEDEIQWLLSYGSDVDQVSSAATDPQPSIASEAESFCALYEGAGYRRSSDDVIAAMSDEPAIQNIPVGLHCMGVPGIERDVGSYPSTDIIGCGDIATNGQWSAQGSTIESPSLGLGLVGVLVRQHVDGKIHRQYNQYTQTSGTGSMGFGLDE